jgi:hypothetical protein
MNYECVLTGSAATEDSCAPFIIQNSEFILSPLGALGVLVVQSEFPKNALPLNHQQISLAP